MKSTINIMLFFFVVSIIITSCNHKPSYNEVRMSLGEQEKSNPKMFLSVDGTYRKNFVGEWVIEGMISNSASVANYKDVVLKVDFYSKTKTFLGSERHTLFEYFNAGKSRSFKLKTYGYKGTSSVGLVVESAISSN